jgi:hypothetical protein
LASSFFEILDQLTVIAKEPFTLFEILGRWEGRQRRREGEWLRMRDKDERDGKGRKSFFEGQGIGLEGNKRKGKQRQIWNIFFLHASKVLRSGNS